VSLYFQTSEFLYSLIGLVIVQVAAVGDMGDAEVLCLAVDAVPEVVLVDTLPVNPRPRPQSLDNLIRDLDFGMDEMWREGREPPPSSCATSLGPNDVEIHQYCTCDIDLEEVNSKANCDGDTLILCCEVYRPFSDSCNCELP